MVDDELQGFADHKFLKARFEAKSGSFLLGHIYPDHGLNFSAGINDDRHLFVMAGSRAGKGTSMLIPNLLEWQGGVFCIDPKGENAAITAMRRGTAQGAKGTGTTVRHFLNQNVAILDPMGTVKGAAKHYRVNYDPLIDVSVGSDEEYPLISLRASWRKTDSSLIGTDKLNADRKTMEVTLKKHCVSMLRQQGFKGSFPNFYRDKNNFVSLINFQFFSSGGSFCINLGYADPERNNVIFQPHKHNAASKLKVRSTRERRRLGAPVGDRWFSFGVTSYDQFRGKPKPVDEIALTCRQLFLDDAEPWWEGKRTEGK